VSSAVVCVGDVETAYRRVGSGTTVVLLGLVAEEDDRLLTGAAGAACRLIVPDRTTVGALVVPGAAHPEESAFARWLSGFLQGLGLERPHVVATPAFGPDLRAYARGYPAELGQVVIVDALDRVSEAVAWLAGSRQPDPAPDGGARGAQ
jgi:hypothetical protein